MKPKPHRFRPSRRWVVASVGAFVAISLGAFILYRTVWSVEQTEFDNTVSTFRADLDQMLGSVEVAVARIGSIFTTTGDRDVIESVIEATGIARPGPETLVGVEAIVVVHDGRHVPQPADTFITSLSTDPVDVDLGLVGSRASAALITRRAKAAPSGDRYVMMKPISGLAPAVAGAVVDLAGLIRLTVEEAGPERLVVGVVDLGAGETIVHATPVRTDFARSVIVEAWGRPFAFEITAGAAYARSGAMTATVTTMVFAVITSVLLLVLGAVARSRAESQAAELALAEELVKSKDQFVASVSHELRTPLTAIHGFAQELVTMTEGLPSLHELSSIVSEQSAEMAHIVEDLLVAARSQAGTVTILPEPVELCALAGQVAGAVQVGECLEIETRPAIALADPLRVRQIVRNLLSNARRHGGDRLRISTGEDPGVAWLRVEDDGAGIPEADREQIFLPYHRLAESHTQPASVGLGLTVSRDLARRMGGDIVYRRIGTWSVFELTLPTPPNGQVSADATMTAAV